MVITIIREPPWDYRKVVGSIYITFYFICIFSKKKEKKNTSWFKNPQTQQHLHELILFFLFYVRLDFSWEEDYFNYRYVRTNSLLCNLYLTDKVHIQNDT